MPSALLRICSCGAFVCGRCPICAAKVDQYRGSAASRGYDAGWNRFRQVFINKLIALHIVPVCGAALPGGPNGSASRCKAEGLLTGDDLHTDHEPPLTDAERSNPRAVCNSLRVQLLCQSCHSAKTARECADVRV